MSKLLPVTEQLKLLDRQASNVNRGISCSCLMPENCFRPGDLETRIEAFVDHYNHRRYHQSLNNVTPSDVYFGRYQAILKQRETIKQKTLKARRLQHSKHTA